MLRVHRRARPSPGLAEGEKREMRAHSTPQQASQENWTAGQRGRTGTSEVSQHMDGFGAFSPGGHISAEIAGLRTSMPREDLWETPLGRGWQCQRPRRMLEAEEWTHRWEEQRQACVAAAE